MWELTDCLNTKINLNYGNIKMRSYRIVNTICTAPKLQRRALKFKVCFCHGLHMSWLRARCLGVQDSGIKPRFVIGQGSSQGQD